MAKENALVSEMISLLRENYCTEGLEYAFDVAQATLKAFADRDSITEADNQTTLAAVKLLQDWQEKNIG